MNNLNNFKKVLKYIPNELSEILMHTSSADAEQINEIRLRAGRPLSVSIRGRNYFITERGSITEHISLAVKCTKHHIDEAFKMVCDYSIHSFEKEIAKGFITIEGGNRVGISGTASGEQDNVKSINGLNYRIAGQAVMAGESLYHQFFELMPVSMLLVGEPLSGKTTLLKSLCYFLGRRYRVSIVDERSEIAACYMGIPQNDVGVFTDVFDRFNKAAGIETAVRVMSPQIIVCDEIGGSEETVPLLSALNTGVRLLASVHGKSFEEVMKRPQIKALIDNGAFEYGVLLSDSRQPGQVLEIRRFGRMLK